MQKNLDPEALTVARVVSLAERFGKFPHEVMEEMPGDWYDVLLGLDSARSTLEEMNRKKAEVIRKARQGRSK